MKNLLSIFLIMSIVFCGVVYANDYEVTSSDDVMGISELAGRTYYVNVWPLSLVGHFGWGLLSFGESGDFKYGNPISDKWITHYYYTQTGPTFVIYDTDDDRIHAEGTSILDIFIYGSWREEEFFFGFLLPFWKEAE